MINKSLGFIWSIGWWLEDDKAWFIDGMNNTLFCADMNTGECEQVSNIPDFGEWTYRLNPYCMKCDGDIFCIPGYGKGIWIYNLNDNSFTKLDIDKPEQHQLASEFWRFGDSVFIVPADWNKVIEVSISQREIVNYYTLCRNDSVKRSVLVDNKIYAVSAEFGKVYQFDVITKKVSIYVLPNLNERLFAICFDGKKFWISGYQKEVYIWDKENNSITIINQFPKDFEDSNADKKTQCKTNSYNIHLFNHLVFVGEYIWFIPARDRKIVYADKKTAELFVFEIFYEDEMGILLEKPYGIPDYLLEYVRDDRYIGLFSAKNRRILEIDTKHLSYQWMDYHFSEKCLEQCREYCKEIYYEKRDDLLQIQAYSGGIGTTAHEVTNTNSVGVKIHKTIKEKMQ